MSSEGIDALIKRIYNRRNESVWTITVGKKQSGKTNWCLDQMDRIHKLGLGERFGSNVPLKADFEIDFIEDFETLEKTCRMLNPDPKKHGLKRYIYFGSEMGKWLPKDQSWRNTKFIEKLQLVRKYGLCWIGDGIDRIDERVVNEHHFNGKFVKPNAENPTRAYYVDYVHSETIQVYNIPKTKIDFDTYYSANFYMEPQTDNGTIPLDENAQIVKDYIENDCSWKKAGIETKKGKRAIVDIAKRYLKEYGHHNHTPLEETTISEPPAEIREESA